MATDFAQTEDGDILLTAEGLQLDLLADGNLIGRLLTVSEGQLGAHPDSGVGIYDFIEDEAELKDVYLLIQEQLRADGVKQTEITEADGGLRVYGQY